MSETKVITDKVRFSYVKVFEPDDRNKYSVSILIDKKDTNTLSKIEKAIQAAIDLGAAKLGGKKKGLKLPLRDGDEEKEDDIYQGKMFVNANSVNKPGIVDKNLDPLMEKEEFYSGCYGRASLNFYAFDYEGKKGIACGLNNLQKLEDGERLGAQSSAQDDFADDDILS